MKAVGNTWGEVTQIYTDIRLGMDCQRYSDIVCFTLFTWYNEKLGERVWTSCQRKAPGFTVVLSEVSGLVWLSVPPKLVLLWFKRQQGQCQCFSPRVWYSAYTKKVVFPPLSVCWLVGLLVCWLVGLLVGWLVVGSVCWFVGLLVCWFVGLLVCWLVSRIRQKQLKETEAKEMCFSQSLNRRAAAMSRMRKNSFGLLELLDLIKLWDRSWARCSVWVPLWF